MRGAPIDSTFPAAWRVEVLSARPLILPSRHWVYPRDAEEVERGALELMVQPGGEALPFLATCALGFRDPAVPTGVWSTPDPRVLCAVSGGYAYLIDTAAPERFTMVAYRPVLEVRAVAEARLLLFVGHRSILAWGTHGQAWESDKLSDEGVAVESIDSGRLHGRGWDMMADREIPFTLDLATGQRS